MATFNWLLRKSRTRSHRPISSRSCLVTISGIELAEQIKKGQFKTGKFGNRKSTMSELWNAALVA
jgi:hypothetical protein